MYEIVVYDGNPFYAKLMRLYDDARTKETIIEFIHQNYSWATDEVVNTYIELLFSNTYWSWVADWARRVSDAFYMLYDKIAEMLIQLTNIISSAFSTFKDTFQKLKDSFEEIANECFADIDFDDYELLRKKKDVHNQCCYNYYISRCYDAKINYKLNKQKRNYMCYKRQY